MEQASALHFGDVMNKYQIYIHNNKTNQSKLLHWTLNYEDDCNEEIEDYIKHMLVYTNKDDGDDLFWKDCKFEDYSWMVSCVV